MARTYTAYNLRIILVLTLGSLTFGYAYSVISNTLGQPGFITYFGLDGPNQSYANAITGAINGMFSAGGVFGALLAGWMCEARGRKETMNLAALITIIGAAIQTGSINIAMFLAARFITGWGIGMMVVLIPLYQAEICKSATIIILILCRINTTQQRRPMPVGFLSVSMVVGSSRDTPSLAGLALVLISPTICPFNGASPLLSQFSLLWLCCSAAPGSQNRPDGVGEKFPSHLL